MSGEQSHSNEERLSHPATETALRVPPSQLAILVTSVLIPDRENGL